MISVKLTKPKFLTFSAKYSDREKIFFLCPKCNKILGHMISEITPLSCWMCGKSVPNVKGIITRKELRANWHFGKLY
jgi:hypothetical protein